MEVFETNGHIHEIIMCTDILESNTFGVSETAETEAASANKNVTEPVCSFPVWWLTGCDEIMGMRNKLLFHEGKNRLLIFLNLSTNNANQRSKLLL